MSKFNILDDGLVINKISKTIGKKTIVRDISINVQRGQIVGLLGPNGAGKTTMLNVINGFYHPDTGSITFKGETRKRMRPHVAAAQGIARTFQNVALFKGMSTLDNIMTGRNLKMSRWATNVISSAI